MQADTGPAWSAQFEIEFRCCCFFIAGNPIKLMPLALLYCPLQAQAQAQSGSWGKKLLSAGDEAEAAGANGNNRKLLRGL